MAQILSPEKVLNLIRFGVEIGVKATATSASTANVGGARANWIESVIGLFDNYPEYARVIENTRANRQRLDEELIVLE